MVSTEAWDLKEHSYDDQGQDPVYACPIVKFRLLWLIVTPALYDRHPIARAGLLSLRLLLMPGLYQRFHVFFGPCLSWNILIFIHHPDPRSSCQQELMGKKGFRTCFNKAGDWPENKILQSSIWWAWEGTWQDFLHDKVLVDRCAGRGMAPQSLQVRSPAGLATPHCWLLSPTGVYI